MRYLMKQKMFAFGDKFAVKNEAEEDVFFVSGEIFSIGHKLSFQDTQGKELAFIRQKMLVFMPTYEVAREGMEPVVLKKNLTFFRDAFTVEVPENGELMIQGNFIDYEYTFSRDGQTIAQASKSWFSLADTYGVDISEGQDDILVLACVVALDLIHKDHRR